MIVMDYVHAILKKLLTKFELMDICLILRMFGRLQLSLYLVT